MILATRDETNMAIGMMLTEEDMEGIVVTVSIGLMAISAMIAATIVVLSLIVIGVCIAGIDMIAGMAGWIRRHSPQFGSRGQ